MLHKNQTTHLKITILVLNSWSHNLQIATLFNPLNTQLKPIYHSSALLGAHHIFHVSRVGVNSKLKTWYTKTTASSAEQCNAKLWMQSITHRSTFTAISIVKPQNYQFTAHRRLYPDISSSPADQRRGLHNFCW
jgi:hypothetical protein